MSHKVGRNILSLVFSRFFALILVFAGYAVVARYLGPYGFGQFQYVIAYVMIFSVVVDFGIRQLVVKKVSEQRELGEKYLGNFFAVEFILALALFILLCAIAYFKVDDGLVRNAIYVAGFGMFINALTIPYTAIISAYEDMHFIAWVNFLDSVINTAILFSAVVFQTSIVYLALTQVISGIAHILIYQRVIKKYVPNPQLWKYLRHLDYSLVKDLFKAALPFGMLVGFSILYNRLDILVLQHLRGYVETGLYTNAYKFVDLLAFVPAVVSSALYPFLSSESFKSNREIIKSALENYTRYMISLAAPIALGGFVLAPKLIVLLGGEAFYDAFKALQILVFASAILFVYAAVNSIMISQLTRQAVVITFANIIINLAGNIILIPRYGFRAAAAMTVVSELTQAGIYFYMVQKKIVSFTVFRYFIKPIIAAAVMAAVIFPLRFHTLLLTLPLGMAVYALLMFVSGYYSRNDFNMLKSLLFKEELGKEVV